jgi:transglutaminase-like putative cysteine protease
MKKIIRSLCALSLLMGLYACGGDHFVNDPAYWKQVRQDIELKKEQLPDGDLFRIFRQKLTTFEREALMFLYAYMPVGDITDYPGEYYLENIRLSARAKAEMPWGKDVPEDIFRHFVLPVRVNNENLDDSRREFYAELKGRVEGMSLHDAVLEVNHWCHEKVVYMPSDARTSSPLASVKTAYGRCGEESTFTVAALRSVGIPARQVYTPRWAHTDDNHAWVEAWVDGQWRFLGACEPEPALDLGWFNTAASRGMLMHSKVFGRYEGKEEVMLQTPLYTEINLIQNYAPTGKASIVVTDSDGEPVADARVEFKIYNYAEFYTAATRYTDKDGMTSLSAGRGDMLVWASKDGAFGYAKVSFGVDEEVGIALDKTGKEASYEAIDIVPPAESANIPEVSAGLREANDRRLAGEDSIRNAYTATFFNKERAEAFVKEHVLPEKAAAYLVASRGNGEVISQFLLEAKENKAEKRAVDLLSVVSAKDLRDVSAEVLNDHLNNSPQNIADTALYTTCVLNPRVGNEMIGPYKSYFKEAIPAADKEAFAKDPRQLIAWCKVNLTLCEDLNFPNIIISPIGVWRSRVADNKSRKVFFVSLLRSVGTPAWVDGVTGKIQYRQAGGQIIDVDFGQSEAAQTPKGKLILDYKATPAAADPKYYTHFSLSKLDNGVFRLMSYDEGDVDMGGGTSWLHTFKNGITVDAGHYMLVSGVRQSDGSVPAALSFFDVKEGETSRVGLILREKDRKGPKVIGRLDTGLTFIPLNGGETVSIGDHCGCARGGYYVLAILGVDQEPTNHALRDIAALGREFEAWGQRIIFLFPDKAQSLKYNAADFQGLPSTISYGIDKDAAVRKQLAGTLKLKDATQLPIVVIANTKGDIVFKSQGYTIGLGEQLMYSLNHGLSSQ